ncbi:hypothetical protein DV738_g5599, partial [Chaetothyriales sp. CBS 135597]
MGRAQTKMKSLQTPAVEKKRVIKEHDRDYANFSSLQTDTVQVSDQQVIVQEPEQGRLPRSSTSKSMLASISNSHRRSSSSSGGMLTGFRKVLPSINTLKAIPSPFSSAKSDHASVRRDNKSAFDDAAESLLRPVSPASTRSRHRANSDSSLYLTRKPTSISSYDDPSAFASVSEMTNSRLKAITDTLQNSSLRLPKLPSSSSAHPILAEALSLTEGDIVVLGGYRGSVLRDAKPPHRQLWAPLKMGLNLRSVDLELGLSKEDEERVREKVIPSGILSHVGPVDICRRMLKQMRKCPNAREGRLRVHDWGYDWRLSPDLLSQQLVEFLQGLECNKSDSDSDSDSNRNDKNNNDKTHNKQVRDEDAAAATTPAQKRRRAGGAIVIAHSLGGLITRHAVNQRPDLFAGVLYAGSPQHCVNILGPLRNGDDVLLSSRVLTAQVNFTLRTSFALLPEEGRCFFQRDTHERYDLDFFDPKTWDEYPQAYLARTLAEVLAFKRALAHRADHQAGNKYPPHAILFGKTVPTVYGARVASREAILHSDAFDDLAFAAGDGVVLASAAQLPPGYRCVRDGRVESDRGHVSLLGDLDAVGKCIAALVHARNKGVGSGNFE